MIRNEVMNFSSKTCCVFGIALLLAAIVGFALADLIHPQAWYVMPINGSDPNADVYLWKDRLSILGQGSLLAGMALVITGAIKDFRKAKNAKVSN